MIPVYVLILAIALAVTVTVLIMEVRYSHKSKELRDTLKEKQGRINHLNEVMTDRNNSMFDYCNRLNAEMNTSENLRNQLHEFKQKEEQDCGCTNHVFKYKWDTSIGGHVLFCTTHNSLDCISAVPAQCITDCPCKGCSVQG